MIKFYKLIHSENLCHAVEQKKASKYSWINLINPDDDELNSISSEFGLERSTINDMLDYESVPHIEKELREGYISLILRIPVSVEGKGTITIPLGVIFLTKRKIILTICKQENFALTKLSTRPPRSFSTKSKAVFFRHLLRKILNSYMSELKKIESDINEAKESINDALENKEIADLLSKQNTLVYFKTSMVGNKSVLSRMASGKVIHLTDEEKELLEDSIVDVGEAQQLISIYSEIIDHTMSAYASIVSNNLNFVLKILAIITLTISIPTMLFSFYGMNINLPLQNDSMIVIYLLILAFGLVGLILLIFKKKNWF